MQSSKSKTLLEIWSELNLSILYVKCPGMMFVTLVLYLMIKVFASTLQIVVTFDICFLYHSFSHVGMDEEDDQSATLDQVLNDTTRVGYFKGYLASVAQAIKLVDFACCLPRV
jgi:hypothetical protein